MGDGGRVQGGGEGTGREGGYGWVQEGRLSQLLGHGQVLEILGEKKYKTNCWAVFSALLF